MTAKIIKLEAENLKRLRAVIIEPSGAIVEISGRNGQGKSSVLDAIAYALGGTKLHAEQPIRRGEKEASVEVTLEDLVVRRTWTKTGTYLTVTAADGAKVASPQAVLDRLVGGLAFDPVAFARMAPKAQAEALRLVAGLDFARADAARADLYAQRTQANREAAAADVYASRLEVPPPGTPAEEVSAADSLAALQRVREALGAKVRLQDDAAGFRRLRDQQRERLAQLEAACATLRVEIANADADAIRRDVEAAAITTSAKDVEAADAALRSVEETNRRVRAGVERARAELAAAKWRAEADELTRKIEAIDTRKAATIAAAKMPVPGLGMDENGVTLNGLPFAQASAAEQLRASVAMGLAQNPRLRVMLVRDGSLLDAESMRQLAAIAEEHDAQVWVERVAEPGAACGIVIEDGMVAGHEL